jgi:NAD(P)-dependent dehydrogenase (short-subunit alcohol dehydrogenase family)
MDKVGCMQNKRVLVTGAGTGIGRGVALEFAREGAAVAVHSGREWTGAISAVEEIVHKGGKAKAFEADFREIAPVRQLAEEAKAFLGGVDVLVNNAGITFNAPFEEVTPEQFDTLYHVNIRAQFFLTQALLPALVESGRGTVINIASVHAFGGMTEHSIYAGTKGAIVAYTRELSLELIQRGVRVNAIAPGWVFTENHRKTLGESFDVMEAGKALPAGFIAEPSDIGRLAIFLASDESRYIIGQTIICDGGQTSILPLTGDFRGRRKERWGHKYVDKRKSPSTPRP